MAIIRGKVPGTGTRASTDQYGMVEYWYRTILIHGTVAGTPFFFVNGF